MRAAGGNGGTFFATGGNNSNTDQHSYGGRGGYGSSRARADTEVCSAAVAAEMPTQLHWEANP
jgi:hypothetical protein